MSSSTRQETAKQLKYWWFTRGNSVQAFSVRLLSTGSIDDLLEELGKRGMLASNILHQVVVYRFVHDITLGELSDVDAFLNQNPQSLVKVKNFEALGHPRGDHLDFVLQHQPPGQFSEELGEPDDLAALPVYRYMKLMECPSDSNIPSESPISSYYKTSQGAGKPHPILDGRYDADNSTDNLGPPIEIFHPCFSSFKHDMAHMEVPDIQLSATVEYIRKSSAIYSNEKDRRKVMLSALGNVLGFPLSQVVNKDRTTADAMYQYPILPTRGNDQSVPSNALLWLHENKNKIGEGGSAPDVQGALSVRTFWAQENNEQACNLCCCPCFILATAGPYFMVLGAILTQAFIVEPLTPYIRAVDMPHNPDHYLQIARTFCALTKAVNGLERYWNELPRPADPTLPVLSRFLPWPTFYLGEPGEDGRRPEIRFKFIQPLEEDLTAVTFLAKLVCPSGDLSRKIVVKFVDRYGREAHRLLASKGYAPSLLYAEELSPECPHIMMVVMDFVKGKILTNPTVVRPSDLGKQVENALKVLHTENYVFGDLRRQNIMVDGDGKVKLIDFDWAGKDGENKYPLRMNPTINWADGMGKLKIMRKEHDLAMLQALDL